MNAMCRVVIGLFIAAWAVAVIILAVGTWGLFGAERDPLSAIFLLPLGLPWNLVIDNAPESSQPWLAVAAPLINVAILWVICSLMPRRPADDPWEE